MMSRGVKSLVVIFSLVVVFGSGVRFGFVMMVVSEATHSPMISR